MQFLWYDLETFGRDPRCSRIAQFAAIRTDEHLETLEEPVSIFCQPADDLLPSPTACLLTGITPQHAREHGLPEAEFSARVFEEMSRPNTCIVGYNSIRFDDEFIRNLFYRDFFDPYEREWKNGNTRWDLIDTVRMAYALRPEALNWPRREDGAPGFRLEELSAANDLAHTHAHEALSDVEATIGLAKKLRSNAPKLFDYAFALRDKRRALQLLDAVHMTPVLHVSQRFAAINGCAKLVLPICPNPQIETRVIVCDLGEDPTPLLELPAEEIARRLYTRREALPEGVARIGLKEVHANRSPILIEPRHVKPEQFARLGIDVQHCYANAERIRNAKDLPKKLREVFARDFGDTPPDADLAIYAGFATPADKALFAKVRRQRGIPERAEGFGFRDARFEELAFRYRARNFPETLDTALRERWNTYRRARLAENSGLSEYDFASWHSEIANLREQHRDNEKALHLLDEVRQWGCDIKP